jgi:hypothetical protein
MTAASMTNLRKMSMILATAATLLTAPALILGPPQLAQAQQGKDIEARGTGQLICPSSAEQFPGSSPPGDEEIFFFAQKQRGFLFGLWDILDEGSTVSKQGDITGGHIGGKQFTLRGIENFDGLCSSPTPATITITGQCGQGVTIQFRASNGEEGQFTGNVACAK